MRGEGGVFICSSETGTTEQGTFTCAHCGGIVLVPPKASVDQIGGYCGGCGMKLICPNCGARGTCDPLEEKLKRAEASYHARRSYGLA